MNAGSRLILSPRYWYTFDVLGRCASQDSWAAATPIFMMAVEPLKTGNSVIDLEFVRALADLRPTVTRMRAQVVHRGEDVIVVIGQGWLGEAITAAITPITMDWLERCCPRLLQRFNTVSSYELMDLAPDADAKPYLDHHLGSNANDITGEWRTEAYPSPLPAMSIRKGTMPFERRYEDLDAWLLLRPFSQKWLIYAECRGDGGVLYVRRRAAGLLYYLLPFRTTGGTVLIDHAEVSLDERQREVGTPAAEALSLDWVINSFLLGHWAEPPVIEPVARAEVWGAWLQVFADRGRNTPDWLVRAASPSL